MPRDGSGVYSRAAGTTFVPNTTMLSSKVNLVIDDLATDQNTPRPIVAGGTGGTTAATARTNLGVAAKVAATVDNTLVRFDGVTGDQQASTVTVADTGAINNTHTGSLGYAQKASTTADASILTVQNSGGQGLEAITYGSAYASGSRFNVPNNGLAIASAQVLHMGTVSGAWNMFCANVYAGGWTTNGYFLVGATTDSTSTAEGGLQLNPAGDIRSKMTGTGTNVHHRFFNNAGATPTLVGSISTSGAATSYSTSSDERLKKDFADFDSGALIDAMHVYKYAWKVDGSTGYGPKAQELWQVMPQAVLPGNDEEPGTSDFMAWSYDAGKLVPILLREIQHLRQRVAALEA